MSSMALSVAPRQDAPPQVINDSDQGALVTVVAGFLLCWTLIALALRAVVRLRFNGPWGHDDWVITAATLLAVAQNIATFICVSQGYGKRTALISLDNQWRISRTIFALQILYLVAVTLSRVSTALLIARLTRRRAHHLAAKGLSIVAGVWGVAAILIISLRCNLVEPWALATGVSCISPFWRWVGVEIVSMLLEVGILGLAVYLVWGLQLAAKLKLFVISAFLCRPLVIVPLAVRVWYLRPQFFEADPFFNGTLATVLTQVSMHYAIIAATIPVAKPFVKAFHSGYLDPEGYMGGGSMAKDSAGSHSVRMPRAAPVPRINTKVPRRISHLDRRSYASYGAMRSPDSSTALHPTAQSAPVSPMDPSTAPWAAIPLASLNSPPQAMSPLPPNPVPLGAGTPGKRPMPTDTIWAGDGIVETRIEHNPHAAPRIQDAARARRDRSKRRSNSKQRLGEEDLVIEQTRDYEVTYERTA